jgi:hypothetical protein
MVDPSGVGGRLLDRRPGGVAALNPRLVRFKVEIQQNILARLNEHGVKSLIMVEKIFGCPHEEGIDYPEDEACPQCPFWKGRDRYAALE